MAAFRLARGLALAAALSAATAASPQNVVPGGGAPSSSQTKIIPYLEVDQVLDVPINHGGDVLTYTALAAGVDATVQSRRVTASITYRYEHDFAESRHGGDQDLHNGIARATVQIVPNTLSVDAGAIAARTRIDIRGAAPVFHDGNDSNISQVYGGYVGPTLSTQAGPIQIGANYRLGYVRAESAARVDLPAGTSPIDSFDSSLSHSLNASIGMPTGELPFGWTISGGYELENAHQLDQRYTAKFVRGDVVVPVAPTLALTGGVGYENIRATERTPLLDANGIPIVDSSGRFETDPNAPRLLAYATDGLIYDGGVIWRPNRRTKLEVRAGRRYGGTMVTGSFEWRMSRHSGLRIYVYDGIESFGRLLTQDLSVLPAAFTLTENQNPIVTNGGGCIFGSTAGTGGCLNDAFQSLNASNFRNRGVSALYAADLGRWTFGLGGTYVQRKYLAPANAGYFTLNGVEDQSWSVEGTASRKLDRRSTFNAALFADWYKSGVAGAGIVSSEGATASYTHLFGQRLSGQASVGVYTYDEDHLDNVVSGQLLLGVRYQF